jgi:hypothetical protein
VLDKALGALSEANAGHPPSGDVGMVEPTEIAGKQPKIFLDIRLFLITLCQLTE